MNAVKFDFLGCVEVLDIDGDRAEIKFSNTVNQPDQYVTAYCDLDSRVEKFETMVDLDPQNAIELPYNVLHVTSDTVLLMDDFDNVYGIQDMPFKLTGQQILSINEQLLEKAERV